MLRLRRWYCSRFGHRRVWRGSMVMCLRCGNIRTSKVPGHGWLGEEYLDETDPDPTR